MSAATYDPNVGVIRQLCRLAFLPAWRILKMMTADQFLYWAMCFMSKEERRAIGPAIVEFLRRPSK